MGQNPALKNNLLPKRSTCDSDVEHRFPTQQAEPQPTAHVTQPAVGRDTVVE